MVVKKKTSAPKQDANVHTVKWQDEKKLEYQLAEIKLAATTSNAFTACNFLTPSFGEIQLTEAINVLSEKVSRVNAGDLSDLEATLTSQAVSLNAIFNELAKRSLLHMNEHLQATEIFMRLALKAQAQCARTIEVLATMKNPQVIFAKQANIANGNQQVNNGNLATTSSHAHPGKTVNNENELLETNDGSTKLDICTTQTAGGKNKTMATVDMLNRR